MTKNIGRKKSQEEENSEVRTVLMMFSMDYKEERKTEGESLGETYVDGCTKILGGKYSEWVPDCY